MNHSAEQHALLADSATDLVNALNERFAQGWRLVPGSLVGHPAFIAVVERDGVRIDSLKIPQQARDNVITQWQNNTDPKAPRGLSEFGPDHIVGGC